MQSLFGILIMSCGCNDKGKGNAEAMGLATVETALDGERAL